MKQQLMAIALPMGTAALGACTDIPKCSSAELDCNVGAYSEERTYREVKTTTNNINKKPEPVFEAAPAPVEEPAPVTEMPVEAAPAPAPADTQVMEKADEKPVAKGMK